MEIITRTPNLATGEIDIKKRIVDTDEGPRADSTMESLGKLKPVFAAKGTVTAATSSQMSDGAGALLIVSERILREHNLTPLAKFSSFAVKGVPPEIMGIGPKFAIPAACPAVAGIWRGVPPSDWQMALKTVLAPLLPVSPFNTGRRRMTSWAVPKLVTSGCS